MRTARAAVLVLGGAAVAVSALPGPGSVVVVTAALAVTALVLAAVTGWRLAGTVAVIVVTTHVLLAGALEHSVLRPAQLLAATALLLGLLTALDRVEAGAGWRTVSREPARRRFGPALAGVAGGAGVAVTVTADVVPSVPAVVAGLVAAVAALVLATRAHRNPTVVPAVGPDRGGPLDRR
jgi:hypothetical protein